MKPFSSLFLIFSLLSFAFLLDARKSPGDYWKSIMNNEPMPEAIKDLLHPETTTSGPDETEFYMDSNHYLRDFDIRPNVILYHNDADSKKVENSGDGFKMMHGDDKHVKLKAFVSRF